MYFQEFTVIDDGSDYVVHIISLVRIVRDDVVQVVIQTVDRIFTFDQRGFFQVVLWQEANQFAYQLQTVFFRINCKVGHTGFGRVYACST